MREYSLAPDTLNLNYLVIAGYTEIVHLIRLVVTTDRLLQDNASLYTSSSATA